MHLQACLKRFRLFIIYWTPWWWVARHEMVVYAESACWYERGTGRWGRGIGRVGFKGWVSVGDEWERREMERGRDEIRHNTLASIMVFWEPRNLACSLCIILCNAMSILIVRNRLYRFCRPLSIPSSPSSHPLAFRFPSPPKASSRT